MAKSFADMKKKRGSDLEKLTAELQKMNSKGFSNDDDRYWKPEVDKAGNGYAVIRFLPAPQGEDVPFVRIWDHAFQGPGGWYIEKSLTTIGKDDPVSEYNSELWNSGIEANKDKAREQKRRLSYHANIYVVKDPAHPENEGKVFLFKFGKKIFDKLNDLMHPSFEDEKPVNPFDFWEGANFKLKIRNVEGYRNYDKSEFEDPSPLADDDELEAIWKQEHSLSELISEDKFKSYEELQKRFYKVLKLEDKGRPDRDDDVEKEMDFKPRFEERKAAALPEAEPEDSLPASDDDDDDLEYFQKLANED